MDFAPGTIGEIRPEDDFIAIGAVMQPTDTEHGPLFSKWMVRFTAHRVFASHLTQPQPSETASSGLTLRGQVQTSIHRRT